MTADISVIIPCYNAEKYLSETIDSVIGQTLPCREIITIDDGSTDRTLDILESYKDKVKIISIKNSGPAVARNVGIEHATSKYVAFCDADDIWHPQKIEFQFSFLLSNNAKFVCSNAHLIGKGSSNFQPSQPKSNILTFEDLLYCNYIYTSSVLVERQLLIDAGLFSPKFKNMQDWHLWLRIAKMTPIYFLPKKLIYYRLHEQGISKNFDSSFYYANLLINDIISLFPQYSPLKRRLFYSLYFGMGTIAYYYGNFSFARKVLLKALILKPFSREALKYFLLSLGGKPLYLLKQKLKRSL